MKKQSNSFPCDSLKGGKAVAFLLFEDDTLRIVIVGKSRTVQVIFSPVDCALFTSLSSSRSRGANAKQKQAADALQRDIGIFVYDTFRRYVKRHYGVGIACAIVGGNFSGVNVFAEFLEKETKVSMVPKSLSAGRHFLELSLARVQSERSGEHTHSIQAKVTPRRIVHLTIPLVTIGIGCFFVLVSASVLGWYLIAPSDVVQKAEDVVFGANHIERTFTIDFVADASFYGADTVIAGKQIVLTQQKTVTITPTGTDTVRYPLSGTIHVINDSGDEISLRDHTRFVGSNGVMVRTLEGVVIQPRTRTTVSVIADTSDAQEVPLGRLAIVMFDNTVLDQQVYGYAETPLFRASPEVKQIMTEEDIARARHELRIDLKRMLLDQVDWQRFNSVDIGTLSLTQETITPVGLLENGATSPITLTATGRLLVSLVERHDIERAVQQSIALGGKQADILSWEIKNFYYLPDTTKGVIIVDAVVRNKQ